MWPVTYYLVWGVGVIFFTIVGLKSFLVVTLVLVPVMRLWAWLLGGHAEYSADSLAR